MIVDTHDVAVARQQRWSDFGIEESAYDIRWLADEGYATFCAKRPTLCMAVSEIGGRCELRAWPDKPVDGEYFGSDALAFLASGAPLAIYAAKMWQLRLCCFTFHAPDADFMSQDKAEAVDRLPSRYMFRNAHIRTCAALLDVDRVNGESSATYLLSLSKALFAAVLDMCHQTYARPTPSALTGARWHMVTGYLRDHFSEPVNVAALAALVGVPPEQFGVGFQAATGMSLRQWQMDYRVRSAQRLLADDPHTSLVKVATLCGFQDQSHFSRAFFRVVGQTPSAWLNGRT